MIKQEFDRRFFNACLYFKGKTIIDSEYLLLYIDDILLIGKDRYKVNKLKETLKSEFNMKDLGSVRKILRMHIKKN